MKQKMLLAIVIVINTIIGCGLYSSVGVVNIDNRSKQDIDSVVINANGYTIRILSIPAGTVVSQSIKSGMIKGSHDITMTPIIYYRDTIVNGGYYYDDLSGFGGKYRMTIDSTLKGVWRYEGSVQ